MYDSIWDEIHSEREWGKYPVEQVIRFVARNYYSVQDRNKIRILDFGCGAGNHTWYLSREGFDTYAFDCSQSAIERVNERLLKENLIADLKVMDGIEDGYPHEYFDSIIDNVCIYSNKFSDIRLMYTNCFNYLKKGGLLFTSVFGNKTTGYKTGVEIENNTFCDITIGPLSGRGVTHFFKKNEICDILGQIGFCTINIDTMEYSDNDTIVSLYNVVAKKEK